MKEIINALVAEIEENAMWREDVEKSFSYLEKGFRHLNDETISLNQRVRLLESPTAEDSLDKIEAIKALIKLKITKDDLVMGVGDIINNEVNNVLRGILKEIDVVCGQD